MREEGTDIRQKNMHLTTVGQAPPLRRPRLHQYVASAATAKHVANTIPKRCLQRAWFLRHTTPHRTQRPNLVRQAKKEEQWHVHTCADFALAPAHHYCCQQRSTNNHLKAAACTALELAERATQMCSATLITSALRRRWQPMENLKKHAHADKNSLPIDSKQ